MARTAHAEGQKRSPGGESGGRDQTRTSSHGRREHEDAATGTSPAAAAAAPVQAPSAGEAQPRSLSEDAAPGTAAAPQGPARPEGGAPVGPSDAGAPLQAPAGPASPSEDPALAAASAAAPAPDPSVATSDAQRQAPPAAEQTVDPQAAAPAEEPAPRGIAQHRADEDARVGVLAKAARGAGGAPAVPTEAPGGENGSPGGAPELPGAPAGEAAPAPVSPRPHDGPQTGVEQQQAPSASASQDLSQQQAGADQRRPEPRLAGDAQRPGAGHARVARTNVAASRAADAQANAPGTAASGSPATGSQDGVVASAPAAQPAAAGTAGTHELTARAELGEMIDAIHATIELASRRGASQARIALQPEELGEIRIHLSQSADGIVARLTAATPAAAQALAAGRGELHQSLSSLGATLLRLDIGMFEGREGRREEVAGGGTSSRAGAASTEEDESIAPVEGATPADASGGTAAGALVDVLA
jgi:hypothetical protein